MAERPQPLTELRRLSSDDARIVADFLHELPDGDRTFLKEDLLDGASARWSIDERCPLWLAHGPDGEPQAMLSIHPGRDWSAHVGELRLVVGARFRGQGLGRRLARFGLAEAVRLGLAKVVVEVVAERERDIAMFTSIGFIPEALLANHICDQSGNFRDLVLLSHEAGDFSASMDLIGLGDDVGTGGAS